MRKWPYSLCARLPELRLVGRHEQPGACRRKLELVHIDPLQRSNSCSCLRRACIRACPFSSLERLRTDKNVCPTEHHARTKIQLILEFWPHYVLSTITAHTPAPSRGHFSPHWDASPTSSFQDVVVISISIGSGLWQAWIGHLHRENKTRDVSVSALVVCWRLQMIWFMLTGRMEARFKDQEMKRGQPTFLNSSLSSRP